MARYLNLGCGNRTHPAWTNVDRVATSAGVLAHDLCTPLPFEARTFSVVYHSHVLEHLQRADAARLLRECHRVLEPQGVLRVAVPDLEGIARAYLASLEHALAGGTRAAREYDWMAIELLDQCVRSEPGGEMARWFLESSEATFDFEERRLGAEARSLAEWARARRTAKLEGGRVERPLAALRRRLRPRARVAALRRRGEQLLLASDVRALDVGRFRLSGEVHQWMYDRFSLARALREAGFEAIEQRDARSSAIPGWSAFQLDADPLGNVHKPDSLFMEGRRP